MDVVAHYVSRAKRSCEEGYNAILNSQQWASVFGGDNVVVGPRIGRDATPRPDDLGSPVGSAANDRASSHNRDDPNGAAIKYRTCCWQETGALLAAEYICLAVMSLPDAYSKLGWIMGVAATVLNIIFYQYTALILWKFCLRHHEVRDICDIGGLVLGRVG
jgi:hypothetical protein